MGGYRCGIGRIRTCNALIVDHPENAVTALVSYYPDSIPAVRCWAIVITSDYPFASDRFNSLRIPIPPLHHLPVFPDRHPAASLTEDSEEYNNKYEKIQHIKGARIFAKPRSRKTPFSQKLQS